MALSNVSDFDIAGGNSAATPLRNVFEAMYAGRRMPCLMARAAKPSKR